MRDPHPTDRAIEAPIWEKNVSAYAVIGVLGLVGGVVAGVVQAGMSRAIELDLLTLVIKGGVVGSFSGMAVAALSAMLLDRRGWRTTSALMMTVAVAALVFSFTISLLVGLATRSVL